MSASEKLKALDAAATDAPWNVDWLRASAGDFRVRSVAAYLSGELTADANLIAAVRNALPQIVAVVEAAQRLRNDARGGLCDDPFNSRGDKLDAALASLDEALS